MTDVVLPQAVSRALRRIRGAQACLLAGSQVLKKASKNSDWDVFVILKDGMPGWRKTWQVGEDKLEVFCSDRRHIEKDLVDEIRGGRGITVHMFANGQIISDNARHDLRRLTKMASRLWKRGPESLSAAERAFADYDIATHIQDMEDCLIDKNKAFLLMNHAINEFVGYYFKLSGQWRPRPKDRLTVLSKRSPGLHRLIMKFNETGDWRKKAAITISIGKLVGRRFGLRLGGDLSVSRGTGLCVNRLSIGDSPLWSSLTQCRH